MGFTITDEDGAIFVNEDPVGTGKLAVERVVAIRAVTFPSVPNEDFKGALLHINIANGVRLRVSEIDVPSSIQAD